MNYRQNIVFSCLCLKIE